MNKYILLSFIIFHIPLVCMGQKRFEWEVANIGLIMANEKTNKGDNVRDRPGLSLGTAVRLNIIGKKVSTGIDFTFTGWNRYSTDGDYTLHQKSFLLLATSDYNFIKINSIVQSFIGIGLGQSVVKSDAKHDNYFNNTKSHFAFAPRLRIKVFKKVILTTQYNYLGNKNNYLNIKLGYIIGS